jgi:hypothetical protein
MCAPLPSADPLPYLQGLYQFLPAQRLDFILQQTGRQSRRRRRLPAPAVTWLIIALALFPTLPVPQVWRRLHPSSADPEPVESAFTQARQRLGIAPLRRLFAEIARPMATHQTVGAFYRHWRLMGLDSTVFDLPDTPANEHAFGRPGTGRAPGAFPQLRLLALCELGTHALCGAVLKPCRRNEQVMLPPLLDLLQPGMLLLWDRGFFGYASACRVIQTGAHLLARAPAGLPLPVEQRLPDGSYRTVLYGSATDKAQRRGGLPLRVIEYTHDDPNRPGCGERHRLLTDLLEPLELPAAEAPLVYHERWEEELTLDEFKNHLGGGPLSLRSKTPAGVIQEVYGLLLAHYVVRRVMHDAAVTASVDPDRLSFSNSLRVLQCHLPESPQKSVAVWYADLLRELRRQRLRPRRQRWYPRVIKQKMSSWKKKRPEHRKPPQPTKPFQKAVVVLI